MVEFLKEQKQLRDHLTGEFFRKVADLDKLYAKFYKVYSKKKHGCGLSDCVKVYQLVVTIKSFIDFQRKLILERPTDQTFLAEKLLKPF
jgi:DNA mismatch repair protein MSH2